MAKKGLTFLEFLTTIFIVGLLATAAYPSYRRLLISIKAENAQMVICNLIAAENTEWQQTKNYTLGIPPKDNDLDGWAEIDDGSGCYAVGNILVDLGRAPDFEFKIENVRPHTFRIVARGRGGGLRDNDQLILDYNIETLPRLTWSAKGKIVAPD